MCTQYSVSYYSYIMFPLAYSKLPILSKIKKKQFEEHESKISTKIVVYSIDMKIHHAPMNTFNIYSYGF